MAEVADVLEDAAPLRVAKRASGAVSPIPGTASLGQEEPFQMQTLSDREAPKRSFQPIRGSRRHGREFVRDRTYGR